MFDFWRGFEVLITPRKRHNEASPELVVLILMRLKSVRLR